MIQTTWFVYAEARTEKDATIISDITQKDGILFLQMCWSLLRWEEMKANCSTCLKELRRIPSRIKRTKHHFCSLKCKGKWWSKHLSGKNAYGYKNATTTGQCLVCKKKITFLKIRPQKFCSYKCYGISQRNRDVLKCSGCSKNFQRPKSYIYWHNQRGSKSFYCSRKCRLKYAIGEKSPNWIKDRSKIKDLCKTIRWSKKMENWRKAVYKRDNYTCRACGKKSGNGSAVILNAHHIERFTDNEKLRFDVRNGLTLCFQCHKKTHFKQCA